MMRKMLSIVLIFGLVFTVTAGLANSQQNGFGLDRDIEEACIISGYVYNSADGIAKIRENDTWTCTNITVYNVSEYEAGIIDLAIDNNDTDYGEDLLEKDKFCFDAGAQWANWSWGDPLVSVGETNNGGVNYVFFTSTILISLPANYFEETEWEPIPTPIVYAKGDGWINITIPKFTNPVIRSQGSIGTPNVNGTIGFAVYRNGTEHIGNATYSTNEHYFFNDTEFSSTCNYSVSPIFKGNYTAYGRSASLSSDEPALAPLNVVLESPNGGEAWKGGSVQDIKYSIAGGLAPYTVALKNSTDGGGTYPNTINTIVKQVEGECTYAWTLPETDANAVKVKVEVTDDAFVSKSDASDSIFIIDSTAPTVESTIPPADGSVSIKKPVTIMFSEKMNQTATQSAFSISPNPGGWSWEWNDAGDTMIGTHNDFVFGETYTVTITTAVKDLAGNCLANDYSWNFTANMSICLNSPKYGDVWTGGVEHGINYTISGGIPNYEVKIYYSYNGGDWSFIAFDNRTEAGTYEYLWEDCPSIDSETVNVKIIVIDANETESSESSGNFEIDSTAPFIITYTRNDTYITTTESITVVFSEEMNKTSAESAFVLKDSSGNPVNGTFSWNGNTMRFTPDIELASGADYTATINTTVKDKSDPGNNLNQTYSWTFTAVQGWGDLIVSLSISPSPEKGKTSTLTVTVSNTGPNAENLSGLLTVKFYTSRDGETWTLIATKYIQNIWAGNSSSASIPFTFDDYGSYYPRVEVTSNNPTDTFPGGETTGRASASVNILQPAEEIGIGPYALIALMVLLVIVIGFLVMAGYKKEGKEEARKESEEEKGEE